MRPRNLIAGVTLTIGIALAALAETGGPVVLAPDQMRAAASLALQVGDPQRARAFADALLQRDRDDLTALLIHARALRDLGETGEALTSARRAWRLAEAPGDRYAAAMVLAQVHSTAGRKTMAQLWLRRAVQAAPDDRFENRAIRDFRYVRATNPWATRLNFSVTPDSNINNGSSSRSSFLNYRLSETLFGEPVKYALSGSSQALSGIEYALGADTRFRFSQTETRAHDLLISADARLYSLSSDAKAQAPDAKGSDFSYASAFLGYGFRGFNFDKRGEFSVRADAGQAWHGGQKYASYLRASAGQTYNPARQTRLSTRLAAERRIGQRTADLDTFRLDLGATRRLSGGATVRVGLQGAVSSSPTASEEFTEAGLSVALVMPKPVLGANVEFSLGYRSRDYDVSPHSRDGRQEQRVSGEMTFVFPKVDYYGFNPTMTVYGSKTTSNIGLYDSERFGINFGIQSAF